MSFQNSQQIKFAKIFDTGMQLRWPMHVWKINIRILLLIPCQGGEFDEKLTEVSPPPRAHQGKFMLEITCLTWNKDFILFFLMFEKSCNLIG